MFQTDETENLKSLKYILNRPTDDDPAIPVENYKKGYIQQNTTKSSYGILNEPCYLEGRNKLWLSKILKESEKAAKIFVVVGAAHISDNKTGLVELLKLEGFSIKKIEN